MGGCYNDGARGISLHLIHDSEAISGWATMSLTKMCPKYEHLYCPEADRWIKRPCAAVSTRVSFPVPILIQGCLLTSRVLELDITSKLEAGLT